MSEQESWMALIRRDHPRLFFNRDTWPSVKARALNEESELFAGLKDGVDRIASGDLETRDYGGQAAEAAFVFLVTADKTYLDLATRLLQASLDYYHQCYQEKRSVNWYSYSRINAITAYDWIYNHLPTEKRKQMGLSLLTAVQNEQPTKDRKPFDQRENWLGPISGFYSTPSLIWYAGLAAYRDGINDSLAADFVARGRQLHLRLLEYRGGCAGDDGGSASASLNYSLAAYPWAEFNFFHTYRSATGANLAPDWPYVAYLPGYIFWNWLPGVRYFGIGDSYHSNNRMPTGTLNLHLSQIMYFYSEKMPEVSSFAKWMLADLSRERRSTFSFSRFLLTGTRDIAPQGPPEDLVLARHFENMGQLFFRSGSGPDDTYACFTSGGNLEMHKHYDHNNFVIFKKGFLALDTGTRPEPGQHLSHYYCRTVAHNCILINLPGEVMPRYWGNPAPGEEVLPVPNDGGQRELENASRVVAFETADHFAYAAGEATRAYHPDKCRLALRQFVFLPPDWFVVFDRVGSTKPEYKKTWLLHTATEPKIKNNEFYADQDQGRLFCRTLLPEKAVMVKIGGPGKQFWSGGRNWPLPKPARGNSDPDTVQLLGQWRIEVSPQGKNLDDLFLHLIQVGDRSLAKMAASRLVRQDDRVGVSFSDGGSEWQVLFATQGEPAGHLTIRKNGALLLDQELARQVQPQKGLFGKM